MKQPFFTIGHSNRSLEEFTGLLNESEIELVADVRRFPMSRANPQFNNDRLAGSLADLDIGYEHIAALGGLRGKAKALPQDVNDYWTNKSFHNYADFALTEDFQEGFGQLLREGHERRCAIMCSEAVWWRCHRRIVADYLIAHHEDVFHILAKGRVEPARLSAGASIRPGHTIVYPAAR